MLVALPPVAFPEDLPSDTDIERVVFQIDYVGTDYASAIADSKILDDLEYGEALRFSRSAIRLLRHFEPPPADALAAAHELVQQIERRAEPSVVRERADRAITAIARLAKNTSAPQQLPNLDAGRRLWASDCAPCHGLAGDGDGPLADALTPKPLSLRDPARLDRLSPLQIFRTLTFGIEGTAMPSFVPAYSEQERWDVAFFTLSLRESFQPRPEPIGPEITLHQLASRTNSDLRDEIRRSGHADPNGWLDFLRKTPPEPRPPARPTANGSGDAAISLAALQNDLASVAERVFPHVVSLWSYRPITKTRPPQPPSGTWSVPHATAPAYEGYQTLRGGTGVLLDEEGFLLAHPDVVRDHDGTVAAFAHVDTDDDSQLLAKVVGTEPTLGLAVLRLLDPSRLPRRPTALEIGDSERLRAGHFLIALGAPPGPTRVMELGIASAVATRQCYQDERSATLIQSNLRVPPQAIGGPVVDIQGRLVGISVPSTSGNDTPGTDAASVLPINLALNVFEPLRVAESNRSPWLGISVLELDRYRQSAPASLRDRLPSSGLYLDNVFAPSPASRAGIRVGDILVEFAGHPILAVADFQTWLYTIGIGQPCALKVWRDGKHQIFDVVIEARPADATTR